ncbi:MAG: type VI secretion system ATPase TssH [Pseudomonadota bacterium]
MLEISLKPLIGRLSTHCRDALGRAASACIERGDYEIGVEHLLLELMAEPHHDVQVILRHHDIDPAPVLRSLHQQIEQRGGGHRDRPVYSSALIDWVRSAWLMASVEFDQLDIRSGIAVLTLLGDRSLRAQVDASELLSDIDPARLRKDLAKVLSTSREPAGPRRDGDLATGEGGDGAAPAAPALANATEELLERFTTDLTAQARAGDIDPIFCRDDEIRQVIDVLSRRRKNNPLAVGDAGVGKTALVEGLALRIAAGEVPPPLADIRLLALDLQGMQAGASVRGEFEKRLKGVIDGVRESGQSIVLFIDEVHTLIGAGGAAGTGDAANILKPALARGELRTIAATTWTEYKKYIEKDSALARRFHTIKLGEPSPEQATTIMRGLRERYEQAHGVYLRDDAVVAAAQMSARYIAGRLLPDKAVDVLDTACARVRLSQAMRPAALERVESRLAELHRERGAISRDLVVEPAYTDQVSELDATIDGLLSEQASLTARWERERDLCERVMTLRAAVAPSDDSVTAAERSTTATEAPPSEEVPPSEALSSLLSELEALQAGDPLVAHEASPDVVAQVIADWTGIPLGKMVRDEAQTVLGLRDQLEGRIRGQGTALESISQQLRAAKAGLSDPSSPLGVFLLVGPSGVGKTETAYGLADLMFGGERFLTTVNMSEFMERHAVSRLIGSPPGYVDSDKGGVLTEAVRQRPYSVVLLDEVEKAHRDVMNLFYQVFDRGELADGQGVPINFRNTLILMTSNLGSDDIIEAWRRNPEIDGEGLAQLIRPTLLGHFPPALLARMTVVPYLPLADEVVRDIVGLKLDTLAERLATAQRIEVFYDDAVVEQIAGRCLQVDAGARMIDLVINGSLVPTISAEVLGRLGGDEPFDALRIGTDADGAFTYQFS